jgi:putative transposase
MPQSLARILIHLIYSTKHRERILGDDIRDQLHAYAASVLKDCESPAIKINSVEDHIHILYSHSKNYSPAKIVEAVKVTTSKWLKRQGPAYAGFHWQNGYGDFSVSQSNVSAVVQYITEQQAHHRRRSFQEEYREFLERHQIPFDEQYVWD